MKLRNFVPCLMAGALALNFCTMDSFASDHIDSPTLAHDHATDLNDTWAFLDPNDNTQMVLMMSTNPFLLSAEIIGQAIWDSNVRYRFEIETTGDAKADKYVDVRFSKGVGRLQTQDATITLPGGWKFKAKTTVSLQGDTPPELVVTTDKKTGTQFFAGAVDDPFFLDNTAANRFVLSSIMTPGSPDRSVFSARGTSIPNGRDTYAGFNALVTAIRIPVALLKGKDAGADGPNKEIGVNSVVQRQKIQVVGTKGDVTGMGAWRTLDRDGTPLVNNGLIPANMKNEYNASTTSDDARGKFKKVLTQSLKNFGTNDEFIGKILAVVQARGDILRVKTNVPNTGSNPEGGFPNGRRLADDVSDMVFTLINNGALLTDFVDTNEVPFRSTFPFVADPIQPNPNGVDSADDRTRL
ncbi:MAG TPA: DUF4331 family protein [Bacteriovoracaceae bacterium]|nr:DUF4331 family protein [Bacteriovoracaceae bacterium]